MEQASWTAWNLTRTRLKRNKIGKTWNNGGTGIQASCAGGIDWNEGDTGWNKVYEGGTGWNAGGTGWNAGGTGCHTGKT